MIRACDQCALERKEDIGICDLQTDILKIIVQHLSILDYISCRAVCKCWRSAFLLTSEKTCFSQAHQRQPWFLLLDTNDSLEHNRIFRATSKLGNLADKGTIYNFDMPELQGMYVLLSKFGWLLLYSFRDLFFFHLLSRTRIDVPYMNVEEKWNPIFDISAPPTSPDHVLFVVYSFSNNFLGCDVKCWSSNNSSWSPVACKKIFFKMSRFDVAARVNEKWYHISANEGYRFIDVADGSREPISKGSGLSRREKECGKAILVEPTGLTLPST